jgi:preprotein translocase subunit SecA
MVILTERGIEKAESLAGVDSFYTGDNMDWPHHIETALKAHNLYKLDRDYVIKDGGIVIVDEFTGRLMEGRRWSDGLHQAIEAKEGIKIQEENQTLATITLQNYFKMYTKLAGMTGTAATEAMEFEKIYKLEVVVIPTNRPLIRYTYPDRIYGTEDDKFNAVEEAIVQVHQTGRPILVGTTSIEKSELLSRRLKLRGIKHEVLNAKHHEREAYIIAKAGQRGNVTISTNMAGRGTDIILGEGVAELGGLHVIGTERHEARRIDNQLRGRAGRQGDPGSSQFFLSVEDDLFRKFAPPWMRAAIVKMGLSGGEAIESNLVTRAIAKAQKNVEEHNFEIRKSLLEYDAVMNEQRKVIYTMRQNVLKGEQTRELTLNLCRNRIYAAIDQFLPPKLRESEWDYQGLASWFTSKFGIPLHIEDIDKRPVNEVEEVLTSKMETQYTQREDQIGPENMRQLERFILLDKIDEKWKDHLHNMDQLRSSVGLRGIAQIDPKLEYKREGADLFASMMASIQEDVCELIFKFQRIAVAEDRLSRRWRVTDLRKDEFTTYGMEAEATATASEEKPRPIVAVRKPPRNAPCPCGSGKKYKKCCGIRD